jgi:hypothetical protein
VARLADHQRVIDGGAMIKVLDGPYIEPRNPNEVRLHGDESAMAEDLPQDFIEYRFLFRGTAQMCNLRGPPFCFPWNRIRAIGKFCETEMEARPDGRIGKRTGKKSANKMGRNPLKSHEIAKSYISCLSDFNSLRGTGRNEIVSQAKLSSSQAKFSLPLVKHFGRSLFRSERISRRSE